MLRGKSAMEDSDTLLAKGLIPIIDLAHCGMNNQDKTQTLCYNFNNFGFNFLILYLCDKIKKTLL